MGCIDLSINRTDNVLMCYRDFVHDKFVQFPCMESIISLGIQMPR